MSDVLLWRTEEDVLKNVSVVAVHTMKVNAEQNNLNDIHCMVEKQHAGENMGELSL